MRADYGRRAAVGRGPLRSRRTRRAAHAASRGAATAYAYAALVDDVVPEVTAAPHRPRDSTLLDVRRRPRPPAPAAARVDADAAARPRRSTGCPTSTRRRLATCRDVAFGVNPCVNEATCRPEPSRSGGDGGCARRRPTPTPTPKPTSRPTPLPTRVAVAAPDPRPSPQPTPVPGTPRRRSLPASAQRARPVRAARTSDASPAKRPTPTPGDPLDVPRGLQPDAASYASARQLGAAPTHAPATPAGERASYAWADAEADASPEREAHARPTPLPTRRPTPSPTESPTPRPTPRPSPSPTVRPGSPTAAPRLQPDAAPDAAADATAYAKSDLEADASADTYTLAIADCAADPSPIPAPTPRISKFDKSSQKEYYCNTLVDRVGNLRELHVSPPCDVRAALRAGI